MTKAKITGRHLSRLDAGPVTAVPLL